MFQISRCAMMLGCALPNRLLIGILTFRIGSQMVQRLFVPDVLNLFPDGLAPGEVERGDQRIDEPVDLRLFRRGRLLLAHEPIVRNAR